VDQGARGIKKGELYSVRGKNIACFGVLDSKKRGCGGGGPQRKDRATGVWTPLEVRGSEGGGKGDALKNLKVAQEFEKVLR